MKNLWDGKRPCKFKKIYKIQKKNKKVKKFPNSNEKKKHQNFQKKLYVRYKFMKLDSLPSFQRQHRDQRPNTPEMSGHTTRVDDCHKCVTRAHTRTRETISADGIPGCGMARF